MTVSELIELLKGMPADAVVGYECFSESVTMDPKEISLLQACEAREDGWIQNQRPDKPAVTYVIFPGN